MKPYGLVLAGGGAKGAYQMGAWKAMIEMGVEFEAVAGTSIGAINGALIAQGDFDTAMKLWNNAEVTSGIKLETELKSSENLFSFSNFPQIFHEVVRNGGVDITPAKQLVMDTVDEKKVRSSGIPVGIVTFELNTMKPVEKFIEDMPEGQLIDYLMASARFPGLNKQGPDDKQFLDGGVYDNAPFEMLRKRGINRIIVIDISNMKGIGHKDDWNCSNVIYIRPFNPAELGAPFEFDREFNEMRMTMGYLDAKKAFGHLYGMKYYFSKTEYKKFLNTYGYETCDQLESLAYELGIDRLRMYGEKQFMKALTKAYAARKAQIDAERQAEIEAQAEANRITNAFHRGTKMVSRFMKRNTLEKLYPQAVAVFEDEEKTQNITE